MKEYKDIVNHVLNNGLYKFNERTKVGTYSVFNYNYSINVSKDSFPLLTTKEVNFNAIVAELLWYLSGSTNITELKKYTKIWDPWADEFNEVPSAYGFYWRNFPSVDFDNIQKIKYIDQIDYVIKALLNKDYSNRRLVVTAWEPGNATTSDLPPCHYTFAFNVTGDNKLNLHLTQRSCDIAIGLPFNIAAYSLLLLIICDITGLQPGKFAHTIIDAHIYENHVEGLKRQIKRDCLPLPKVKFKKIKDIDNLSVEDFQLIDYQSHAKIKFTVAV